MRRTHPAELFSRFEGNPILTAADCPHTVNAVFNPAAVQFEGETLLLVRVDDRRGISHLCVARSADGLTGWVMEADRSLLLELGSHAERFGIEDPRITLDAHKIGLNTPGCARSPRVRFRPKIEIRYTKLESRRTKAGSYTLIGYYSNPIDEGSRFMSDTLTYTVPGMHCGHCEAAVTEEVSGVAGVESVSVDLDSKRVDVTGAQLDDAAIRAAIEEAGYEAA